MNFYVRRMLTISAIKAAILVILTILAFGFFYQEAEREVHRNARVNSHFAAALIGDLVVAGDLRRTDMLLRDILANANLVSLEVRDLNGRPIATAANGTVPDTEKFVQAVPIVHNGKRVGTIVTIARNGFLDKGFGSVRLKLVVGGLLLLLLSSLVSWAFVHHLSQHLRVIRKAARRISGGVFDVSIPVTGPIEFRAAARAMNTMGARIGELHDELHRTLADRTHALESTFDNMAAGVAIFDAEGHLLTRNPTFAVLTGVPDDVFGIGATLDGIVDFHASLGAYDSAEGRQIELLCRCRRWPGPSFAFELPFPDGHIISVRRTRLPDGGFIAIHEDVTRERDDQRRLLHAAKLATLGELATATAHELNQPLNVIRLSADNARARIIAGTATDDYLVMKFGRIAEQAERAAAIIDHMRVFGRKPEEKSELFDLGEAVRSAVEFFTETARLEGYLLDFTITPGLTVRGYPALIEQVVANLISNALATFRRADVAEPRLRISVTGTAGRAVAEVADNAGGIPEHLLSRIFEPFFTTKPGGEGTGLGLSISYGIISDMCGRLSVRNEDGGATFSFALPIDTALDLAGRPDSKVA